MAKKKKKSVTQRSNTLKFKAKIIKYKCENKSCYS